MRSHVHPRASLALALLAAGCGSVDPRPDYAAAQAEIRAATGAEELHDPEGPVLAPAELSAALADGLGLAEATRLALLNNRRLQAGFLELGVARADFVQAGLLENPSLSLAFLFPSPGGRVRWTADLFGSVAEIWRLPARRRLAAEGLELSILELSRFAGELVAETRSTYCAGVAAHAARAVARENAELAGRALAGVRRQVAEGVASKLDEGLAESVRLEAELALRRAERAEATHLRRLAALLSLEGDLLGVTLTDPLPEPVRPELAGEALVERSVGARADVRAAARAVATAEAELAVERGGRFGVAAGVSVERPEGGGSIDLVAGPGATLELPLFDQNRAQVARAEYALAQRQKELEAVLADARQEIRAALDRAAVAAQAAAFARTELVPQAQRTVALAEKAYELGDTTVLALLQSQKAALDARHTEIEARLEAALAEIELERAAGAPLDAARGVAEDP